MLFNTTKTTHSGKKEHQKYVQENKIAGNEDSRYVVGMFKGRWKRETMGAGKEANVR